MVPPGCCTLRHGMIGSREWRAHMQGLCYPVHRCTVLPLQVDVRAGSTQLWQQPGHFPGEPVFVARPGGQREDDGVLLSVVLAGKGVVAAAKLAPPPPSPPLLLCLAPCLPGSDAQCSSSDTRTLCCPMPRHLSLPPSHPHLCLQVPSGTATCWFWMRAAWLSWRVLTWTMSSPLDSMGTSWQLMAAAQR